MKTSGQITVELVFLQKCHGMPNVYLNYQARCMRPQMTASRIEVLPGY